MYAIHKITKYASLIFNFRSILRGDINFTFKVNVYLQNANQYMTHIYMISSPSLPNKNEKKWETELWQNENPSLLISMQMVQLQQCLFKNWREIIWSYNIFWWKGAEFEVWCYNNISQHIFLNTSKHTMDF